MKLLDLNIENYGVYTARHFDFTGPGFRLIYGPNEAGKSTLLQLIREVLFGFPHVSPYVFGNHSGKLAATVRMEMENGRRVRFRRQKGSKNTVTGEVEEFRQPVDDGALRGLLGNAGGELFEHVFGISLNELAAGEKSLRHANLTEALYGSGVGGLAGFQQLQQALRDEHLSLFSPRARKPEINRLLALIAEKSQAFRESTTEPREYSVLQESLDDCNRDTETLSQQLAELRKDDRRMERLSSALNAWSQCKVIRSELAKLESSDRLPGDAFRLFTQIRERRDETSRELERLKTALAMLPDPADVSDPLVPNVPPEIDESLVRSLSQEIGRIRDCMRRLPELREQSGSIRQTLSIRLQQINPDWTLRELTKIQATQPRRELIRELNAEWSAIQTRKSNLAAQRPELQRQFDVTRQRIESLSPDVDGYVPCLDSLIDRSSVWDKDRNSLAGTKSKLARLNVEIESLVQRLRSILQVDEDVDPVEQLKTFSIPLKSDVEAARTHQTELTRDTRLAGEQLKMRQQEQADAEQRLNEQEAAEAVVSFERLKASRDERDISWKMIRQRFIDPPDEATPQSGEVTPAPDEFERTVSAADSLADDRFRNAEAVARREHLVAEVAKARQLTESTKSRLQQLCSACETAESAWRQLWPQEMHPTAPEAMLEWLRLHSDFVETTEQREMALSEEVALKDSIERYEAELIRALQTPLASPEASLAQARQLCESRRKTQHELQRLNDEMPDLDARLRSLDDEIQAVDQSVSDWNSKWQEVSENLGLPREWSAQVAGQMMNQLAELQLNEREAKSLEDQVALLQSEVEGFSARVAELTRGASDEMRAMSPEDAIVRIARQIDETRQAAVDHHELVSQRKELSRQITVMSERHEESLSEFNSLLGRAEVATEEELVCLIDTDVKRQRLEEQRAELEREICIIRADENEQSFVEELAGLTPEKIAVRQEAGRQRISQLEFECQEALQKAGAVRQNLESLKSNTDSITLAAELESLRSELGTSVEQWAGLVITQSLMTRALARFEREHQPRLLTEVARLLSQMTDGRYTGIERKLDRTGTLLVRNSYGQTLEPSSLSTGTREQLYLAIRIAFALQYCEESEPLPLILDDILVNFDHHRTRNTLKVLADVSDRVQIIFLTCHRHMLDMAAGMIPGFAPIFLNEQDEVDWVERESESVVFASQESPLAITTQEQPVATATVPRPKLKQQNERENSDGRQPELF
jgi:uncharacterized protein YhaN